VGAITSDGDPRFSLQPRAEQEAVTFADLKATIGDRLANGALELAIVGDIDEQATIDAIAATLGALPAREAEFRPYEENRQRRYTDDRSLRVLYHGGATDQALLRLSWPTTDGADQQASLTLDLLGRVAQLALTEALRERLGQAYSPRAGATQSRIWPGYGEFTLTAAIAPEDLPAARAAMLAEIARLGAEPIAPDELLRARRPLEEAYANALKSNAGWLGLATRAQSRPEDIARFQAAPALLSAITPAQLQAAAVRWLDPARVLEIDVLPRPLPKEGAER
jgi:zinc protease